MNSDWGLFAFFRRKWFSLAAVSFVWFLMGSPGHCAESKGMIGADACLECHGDFEESFVHTTHGRAFSKTSPYYENRCEYCHGAGEAHQEDESEETIITFGPESERSGKERNRQCLNCHESNRQIALWRTSLHGKRDLTCDACHTAHRKYDPVERSPEACYACHLNVKMDAQKQSRHPVREGKVGCGSCHNPHGTLSDHMIVGDDVNDLCYRRHAEKRGPFMWEHSPVEENCGVCHRPHGSRHKKLLVQRTPSLCQNCHMGGHTSSRAWDRNAGFKGSRPSNRYYGRSCLTCHPNIHGSQAPNSRGKRLIY